MRLLLAGIWDQVRGKLAHHLFERGVLVIWQRTQGRQ
jgi:hypothetical protein